MDNATAQGLINGVMVPRNQKPWTCASISYDVDEHRSNLIFDGNKEVTIGRITLVNIIRPWCTHKKERSIL